MPTFVMIGWDGPRGAELRRQHHEAHVKHVSAMNDAERIRFAGPIKSDDGQTSIGAVIVFDDESVASARATAARDPYVAQGVFATLTINPILHVFPKP